MRIHPRLIKLARTFLSISASSGSVERLFFSGWCILLNMPNGLPALSRGRLDKTSSSPFARFNLQYLSIPRSFFSCVSFFVYFTVYLIVGCPLWRNKVHIIYYKDEDALSQYLIGRQQ